MGMSKYKRHGESRYGCSFILMSFAVLVILVLAAEMVISNVGW